MGCGCKKTKTNIPEIPTFIAGTPLENEIMYKIYFNINHKVSVNGMVKTFYAGTYHMLPYSLVVGLLNLVPSPIAFMNREEELKFYGSTGS